MNPERVRTVTHQLEHHLRAGKGSGWRVVPPSLLEEAADLILDLRDERDGRAPYWILLTVATAGGVIGALIGLAF